MLKKLLILGLLGIVGASAYLYWDYTKKRTVITPYPYTFLDSFDEKFEKDEAKQIKAAENAKILIVGDRMAKTLIPFEETLQDRFKESLKTPPTIFNWAGENEGLFRTIHKLKKLKKLPPIVIYFGASSELQEKRFEVNDKNSIFKNFTKFDDEKTISLIITFPWLSKFVYEDLHYIDLGPVKNYVSVEAGPQKLVEKEVAFKLFTYELREMIGYVKDKKSKLVFITAPINLEVGPKEVCAHATSTEIIAAQQELEAEVNEGKFKDAYPKLKELSGATYSNARSFYLLGKAAMGAGDIKAAREAFQKASVFDCSSWRADMVYNSIMRAQASASQMNLVDFDQFMSSQLSNEGLFFDEITPQNVFYQTMIKELGDILKTILSVND